MAPKSTDSGSWFTFDPASAGMDPNDFCPTEDPCWVRINIEHSVRSNPNEKYVNLVVENDYGEIARGEFYQADITSFTDVPPQVLNDMPRRTVWLSYIEVKRFARGLGIGWSVLEAAHKVLKDVGGLNSIHLFVDNAGWWPSIAAKLPDYVHPVEIMQDVVYYVIP